MRSTDAEWRLDPFGDDEFVGAKQHLGTAALGGSAASPRRVRAPIGNDVEARPSPKRYGKDLEQLNIVATDNNPVGRHRT